MKTEIVTLEKLERIEEIDFVKGVLITLMVLFHLGKFTTDYPSLTTWVYTFHMSGFLLISGYLLNINKSKAIFFRTIKEILIPYLIFELIYYLGLGVIGEILGSSNEVELSFNSLMECLFVSPKGTYWYLHTLLICMLVYIFINKLPYSPYLILLFTGCVLFILSLMIEGLHWENILYFMFGAWIRRLNFYFKRIIVPSYFSLFPILLITYWGTLGRGTLSGLGITVFVLSFLMGIHQYLICYVSTLFSWLGRNSLSIVLFSPIFTVMTKFYTNLFAFDSTHVLWAMISLTLILVLCIILSIVCDKIGLSKLWGRKLYSSL